MDRCEVSQGKGTEYYGGMTREKFDRTMNAASALVLSVLKVGL